MNWLRDHFSQLATARNGAILLVVVLILAFWGGGAYRDWKDNSGGDLQLADTQTTTDTETEADNPTETTPTTEVAVHVTGEVAEPGVYTLDSTARVDDAVRLASPKATADLDQLNLAQHVTDGMKIVVPKVGETATASATSDTVTTEATSSTDNGSGTVNINTADLEQLKTLPNIGDARAQAIIDYREKKGRFTSPEDLKKVSGIGDKIYTQLASQITTD